MYFLVFEFYTADGIIDLLGKNCYCRCSHDNFSLPVDIVEEIRIYTWMKYFIGIDPGVSGAVVVVDDQFKLCALHSFSEFGALEMLRLVTYSYVKSAEAVFILEAVHAHPQDSATSMFKFGTEVGKIQGYLWGQGRPVLEYSPQTWQRHLPYAPTPKERVRAYCDVTWGLDRFVMPGRRVPDQGMMDAACIAVYGRQVAFGEVDPPKATVKKVKRRNIKII